MEEGNRRLRNCTPELGWNQKVLFLNRFSLDMRNSGHSPTFRKTILKRVIVRYMNSLHNHMNHTRRMYRDREERMQQKKQNEVWSGKDTWFRKGGYSSTLTVPPTPGGQLAEVVRSNLERGRQPKGTKTKVIEGGGVATRTGLTASNQFPRDVCNRKDCGLCVPAGDRGGDRNSTRCDKESVGYEGICPRCPEKYKYVGETSRTAYTRVKEHQGDYRAASKAKLPALTEDEQFGTRKKTPKSWMWEHTRDVHGGQVGPDNGLADYHFQVTNKFQKCLERQVDEGYRIKKSEKDGWTVLNSKNEWFTPRTIEINFKQQ